MLVAPIGCSSSSPSMPSPTASIPATTALEGAFQGVWDVAGPVTECSGLRHCFDQLGQSTAATLRIVHIGNTVEGSAVIGDKLFDVRGTADADVLRLTGHQNAAGGCVGEASLTELVLSRAGSGWSGQFAWTSDRPASCLSGIDYQVKQRVTVATASRATNQPFVSSFTGSWQGRGTTVSCAPDDIVKVCYSNTGCVDVERRPLTVVCESGTKHGLEVALTQVGANVTGTVDGVPVSGSVDNGRVTLSGSTTRVVDSLEPGTHITTISMASFVLDHVGRMNGSYRVDREYFPKNGLPPSRWSQDERLDSVVVR